MRLPLNSLASVLGLVLASLMPPSTSPASAIGEPAVTVTRVVVLLHGATLNFKPHPAQHDNWIITQQRVYHQALVAYQSSELRYLHARNIALRNVRSFSHLLNGFAASVPVNQIPRLKSSANVASVLPDPRVTLFSDVADQLVDAPRAWGKLGGPSQAGRGVYIADIDSGIDITNPCFRDTGMTPPAYGIRADTPQDKRLTNNKVVVARAFGDRADKTYSAADVVGHGTFTAAVAACDADTNGPVEQVSGVAPGAYLMNYNVFPRGSGGPYEDQVIAALESALVDGADVVNLSLGNANGSGDPGLDPETIAVESAIHSGLTVVCAAGNAGPTTQSIASPATAPHAITVGSVSNARGVYSSVEITGTGIPSSFDRIEAREASFQWSGVVGPRQLVNVGLARRPGDDPHAPAANDFAGKKVKGAVVLVQRGSGSSPTTLTVATKVANANKAGAAAVLLYDNVDEIGLPSLDQGSTALPVAVISRSAGTRLASWLRSHTASARIDSSLQSFPEQSAVLSSFSSRGYGGYGDMKPDLVAPGEDIYSATQRSYPGGDMYDGSGFTSQSGTSFAAPHVAGAAALALQAHPRWNPAAVKAVLISTASPNVYADASKTSHPTILADGAGLLDVGAALDAPAYTAPAKANFGRINAAYGPVDRTLHVSINDAGTGFGVWNLSLDPLDGPPGLRIYLPASVSLPTNGQVDIPMHLSITSSTPVGEYDGYVELAHGAARLHVPYYVRIVRQRVTRNSILLIDATASRFQRATSGRARDEAGVAGYFERTLKSLGRVYSYWDENVAGSPGLTDLKRASAVFVFTGHNVNGLASQNAHPDALLPPLDATDLVTLHQYVNGGGRLFVSGMGTAFADSYWLAVVLGARQDRPSIFDNAANDRHRSGGIGPTNAPIVPSSIIRAPHQAGPFVGMQPLRIGPGGDGAHDNGGVYNLAAGFVGVSALIPVRGNLGTGLTAYGEPALHVSVSGHAYTVGVASSDEPTFLHALHTRGRAMLFSFAFESINNVTGSTPRGEVLRRLLLWLSDAPQARVRVASRGPHGRVTLQAAASGRAAMASASWQIDGRAVKGSSTRFTYTFARPGTHTARARVVDTVGHAAVTSAYVFKVG